MKKLLFFVCIIALAISLSYGYDIVPISAWTTQEAILPTTPDNLGTQMAGGVIVGDYLYFIGGNNGIDGDTARVWRLPIDPVTGALGTAIADTALPTAANFCYLYETIDATADHIYISGGGYNPGGGPNRNNVTYNKVNVGGALDPTWTESAAFPIGNGTAIPYDPELGGAIICENGYIYCFGGDGEAILTRNDCFYAKVNPDGSLGAWTRGTDLPNTWWFPAVCSIGNYIIASGGIYDNQTRTNSTDKVHVCQVSPTDGSTGAWVEQAEKLPATVYNLNFVAVRNIIYALGGRSPADGSEQIYCWQATFDPGTGTVGAWSNAIDAQLPAPGARYHDAAYSPESRRLYVFSIRTTAGGITNQAYISSELISPTKVKADWNIYE